MPDDKALKLTLKKLKLEKKKIDMSKIGDILKKKNRSRSRLRIVVSNED